MMNGIRIRPFEAAAILAALTLLTGCSLLKFSVDTGGEPLSKEETRMPVSYTHLTLPTTSRV